MPAMIMLKLVLHVVLAEHIEDRYLVEGCVDSTQVNCTECITGYYLESQTCLNCTSTCNSCESATKCTECVPSYFLSNDLCSACPDGCTDCTSLKNCTSCAEKYYLNELECESCPDLCINCNETYCYECENNTYRNGDVCELCYESELVADIAGPSDYSTTCDSLVYSAGLSIYNSSQPIEFFWEVLQYDSEGLLIWSQNYSELEINPQIMASDSIVKVKLVLSICEQESVSEYSTKVRTSAGVYLNPGVKTVRVLSGSELVFYTEINDYCGLSGTATWTWQGEISGTNRLLLIKNLPIGSYNESVIVKVAGSTTFYNFTIESVENLLVNILSRSSGVASINADFSITGTDSYSLDYTDIKYDWSCYNYTSKDTCINTTGDYIKNVETSSLILNQETLVLDGKVKITLTISAGSQIQSQNVEIRFIDTNESITVPQSSYRNDYKKINYIVAQGETDGTVLWNSSSSISLPYTSILSLWIPSNTLIEKPAYSFNLFVSEINLAVVNFYINSPPTCPKSFSVTKIVADLWESIKIIQPDCEDSDLPLTYNLNYSTPDYYQVNFDIILPLGPTSSVLFVVCDSLKMCTEQIKNINVANQSSSSQLSQIYATWKTHQDLIPLTIKAFGLSAEIPSTLYTTMLADLGVYQNSYKNSQIGVLNALSALTSNVQSNDLLSSSYKKIVGLVDSSNSTHFNSQLQMNYTLSIYSNLARLKSATNLSNSTIAYIDSIKSLTKGYMPGQSFSASNQDFAFFKYTHLGTNLPGLKYQIDGRNISLPDTLPFTSNDIINFYFTIYKNKANYSDYVDVSFTKSGELSNNSLTFTEEKLWTLSKLPKPLNLTLKYRKDVNNKWACAYLKNSEWLSSGCKLLRNDSSLISFSTNHTSLFSVFDTSEVKLPPVQITDSSSGCGKNLNGIWILVVIVFLFIIFLPIIWWTDSYAMKELIKNNAYDNVKKSDSEPSVGSPSFSEEMPSNNNLSSDYAVQYKSKPREIRKHWCKVLIEGHLLFGMIIFRVEFNRVLRLMTLCTVLIFELLLEGLLMMGFETTDEGSSASSKTYFEDYKDKYFGYTIFALVIDLAIQISLVILFSLKGKMRKFGLAAGFVLIIVCVLGSIAGIIIMALKFCPNWSGYWGISFLFGTIVEVVIVQTLLMLFRFLLLKCLA